MNNVEKEIFQQGIFLRSIRIEQLRDYWKNHQAFPGTPAYTAHQEIKKLQEEIKEIEKSLKNQDPTKDSEKIFIYPNFLNGVLETYIYMNDIKECFYLGDGEKTKFMKHLCMKYNCKISEAKSFSEWLEDKQIIHFE